MKAYALDLRERVVKFLQAGGSKAEAGRRFAVARRTVYRYLAAAKAGQLAPKTNWGKWRKLDPQKLSAHVQKQPDATLKEIATALAVSLTAYSWAFDKFEHIGYKSSWKLPAHG
jgi:transposase